MQHLITMSHPHHRPEFLGITKIPLDYNKFSEELVSAQYALGLLEGSQRKLHNSALLISPLTAKEATISSRIEGTISTVSDVFLYDAGGDPANSDRDQTQQVSNYRAAMRYAVEQLENARPLSSHLVQTLHSLLMRNVRCSGPVGEFRNDVVWIGQKRSDSIDKAIYIPPEHHLVSDYIDNLFSYINQSNDSALIQTGIAHYQFEAIHPFSDGNGRIGRLLIPLILYQSKKISQPILYISGYLDNNRDEYLQRLHEVDVTGKYEGWLAFYFKAISEQLKETQLLIDKIYGLHDSIKKEIDATKSPYLLPFIEFIFANPFFTIPSAQAGLKASARNTIVSLIAIFEKIGMIRELKVKLGKAKFYVFHPLVEILS